VKLLQDPKVPYPGVVDLLERVADDASRQAGAAALVKRAAAMPDIPVPVWRTLGALGGKPVIDFLVQRIEKGGKQAVLATQALQQRREPSVLPLALRVAGDQKADKELRDEMFGVIEKIGGPEAQRGLCSIIAADPTELVRYRAYEAALAVGQANAVVPALEAFPQKASYKRDDVADFLAKDITKLGPSVKPAVAKALASSSPVARMAAVMSFDPAVASRPADAFGAAADAPALLKLASDKGTLKGFPAGDTVGKEAARVAGVLQKKR